MTITTECNKARGSHINGVRQPAPRAPPPMPPRRCTLFAIVRFVAHARMPPPQTVCGFWGMEVC